MYALRVQVEEATDFSCSVYPVEGTGGLTVLSLCLQDTFSITIKTAALDVFLPDGRNIQIEILTSDTAERVLEVNFVSTPAPELNSGIILFEGRD